VPTVAAYVPTIRAALRKRQTYSAWRYVQWLLALLLIVAGPSQAKSLSAVDGVLDLRDWSPPVRGWQAVAGEWLFDWGRFLSPDAGIAPTEETVLQPWNRPWWGTAVTGERIGGQGFASYRLRIIPPAESPPLALLLPSPRRSYRLWVNGELLGQSGEPSTQPQQQRTPDRELAIGLPTGADQYQVLIQASNYISLLGTAPQPMLIGSQEALERTQGWGAMMTFASLGAGLLFGLKYLTLFITRRRYPSYLWISLLAFDIALHHLAFAPNYLPDVLPIGQSALTTLLLLSMYALVPLVTLVAHSLYPKTHPRWLLRLILIPHGLLILLTLVAPLAYAELMLLVMAPYFFVIVSALVYCSWRTVRAESSTALWLLAATLLLAATATHDLLWNLGLLISPHYYIFSLGVVLLLMVVLFDQYEIDLLQKVRDLSRNLQAQVAERTWALSGKVAALQVKEKELTSAYTRLEELSRTKSRFLAAASHDLRQPLHAMGLQIGLLEEQLDDAADRATLQTVRDAQTTLTDTLNALLDLSRIDSGLLQPSRRPFPLRELLARLNSELRPVARRQGVDLHVHPDDYWVDSDPILLYRILVNLADNAIKHATAAEVLVGARWRSNGIGIEVRDNGCGIPSEQQQQIFSEFVQLPRADQRRPPGIGLGLSVVQRLSQLLQHPVELRSHPSAGTCFSVLVPRAMRREDGRSPQAPESKSTYSLNGKSVLLVDDDPAVRQATAQLLAAWKCDVLSAADRDQALRIAAEHRIDMIIVDYLFPDVYTGLDLIAVLDQQAGTPHPAIIITGEVDPSILERLHASRYPVLRKPVAPMQLRSVLHRISGSRH